MSQALKTPVARQRMLLHGRLYGAMGRWADGRPGAETVGATGRPVGARGRPGVLRLGNRPSAFHRSFESKHFGKAGSSVPIYTAFE